MLQLKTKVIKNIELTQKYYKIVLFSAPLASKAEPGQFVMIKISPGLEILLRRPFSVHAVKGDNIEILYEVVGKATEVLSQKKPGGYLEVIGPLGKGFNYRLTTYSYPQPILVAGGIGIAPLFFLAEWLVKQKTKDKNLKPLVLIGAKTKRQILCEKEFKDLSCDVKITTDDGTRGFKGKVTALLNNVLSTTNHQLSTIYACGPKPMLEEISRVSQKYKIPAEISLEEHMACGIGACLGCVVKTKSGFQRVCKEGPVFGANEITW